MEQMNGLDGSFLQLENPGMPMTISPFTIYDPSTAPNGIVRFKDILKIFENSMSKASVFRRRVVEVPLSIDHPYWLEDPDFDIEYHVRHIALPKPGDWRQLYIELARLQSRPLDRSRPLWEAYVIEGLDHLDGVKKGSFGIMLKVHHSAMDGKSMLDLFIATHKFSNDEPIIPEKADVMLTETRPSSLSMLGKAYGNTFKRNSQRLKLLKSGFEAYNRISVGKKNGEFHNIKDKEITRFNVAVSPHRSFTRYQMLTSDIKSIANCISNEQRVTSNEVLLTIISGAANRYLCAKKEHPKFSLVAGCPVDSRSPEAMGEGGNHVSMMNVLLHSDITDPIERLRAVATSSKESKRYNEAFGKTTVNEIYQALPPFMVGLYGKYLRASSGKVSPLFNMTVSNVPGIEIPAYFAGAVITDAFGVGCPIDQVGLFHHVSACYGKTGINVTCCRDMMPDPELYQSCLEASYLELKKASDELTASIEAEKK